MFELKGKFTSAKVMIDEIEKSCMAQIVSFLNHPAFTNNVAIMPDTHAGAGAVIGFTMPLGEAVIPNTIGSDISCGMLSYQLSTDSFSTIPLEKLDDRIRELIPFGFEVREKDPCNMEKDFHWDEANLVSKNFCYNYNRKFLENMKPMTYDYKWFMKKCEEIRMSPTRAIRSLGTLGGGNHFIEIGKDMSGRTWITVHSGSRQFGKLICDYWQSKPSARRNEDLQRTFQEELAEIKKTHTTKFQRQQIPQDIKKLKAKLGMNNKVAKSLDYLTGEDKQGYLADMIFTSVYASENRRLMAQSITKLSHSTEMVDVIETVHNYISFSDFIIRKGAVSAHKGERLIIPFNMEDGILLCEGRGNPEWNYSAPHGAGRILPRAAAKAKLDVSVAEKRMLGKGIYTSVIPADEMKEAYKDPQVIEDAIVPTVKIIDRIKPLLNLKAAE